MIDKNIYFDIKQFLTNISNNNKNNNNELTNFNDKKSN